MSSLRKIEANRRNADAATGPRTPEGRAAVSTNGIVHGARSAKFRLYFEPGDCGYLCRELAGEWQPATPTECSLVEEMAIAKAKLIRLERNMTHAFYQSEFMKMIGCEDQYTEADGRVRSPNALTDREFKAQRLITGISQHIARVERAFYKALETLQKLQDRRHKTTARPATQVESAAHTESAAVTRIPPKIDNQSHQCGDPDTREGVRPATDEGIVRQQPEISGKNPPPSCV